MNAHQCQHFGEKPGRQGSWFLFRHPCSCGEDKGKYGNDCRFDDHGCVETSPDAGGSDE